MNEGDDDPDRTMERYRPYLQVPAEAHVHPRLRRKLDASDLVQETLLRAHRGRSEYRGTESERLAWLQVILGHVLD